MRDFKEFLTGELVVQFKSAEELAQFLKLCESKGLTWGGGIKATSYVPDWETEGMRCSPVDSHIWIGALSSYEEQGYYTIIPARVFMSRDFQEFKDGKVAVSVKGDTKDEFLKLCERSGLLWSSGDLPTALPVDSDFCFIRHTPKGLQRGGKSYYTDMLNVAIADYTEFSYEQDLTVPEVVKDEVVPPIYGYYRVEIVRKGRKVVCREYLNGSVINKGTARCHPDDEFDFKFGSDLAYDRMRGREVKHEVKHEKVRVVRQDVYEVGDVVMMAEPNPFYHSVANSFMGKEQVISSVFDDGFYRIEGITYGWHGYKDIAGKVVPDIDDPVLTIDPIKTSKPKFVKKYLYEVGDVVRIKKKWKSGKQDPYGEMDEYLGTNLTISEVHPYGYSAKEDKGRWAWFHKDIKGVVV